MKYWKVDKKWITADKSIHQSYYFDNPKNPEEAQHWLKHLSEKVWTRGAPLKELEDYFNTSFKTTD